MALTAGTKLGRYEIRSKLGEGGMGEVYRAYDEAMHREVAIKLLPAALSADKDRLARLEREAHSAGALNHPNILVIHHIETHEGSAFIVSELLEGAELRDRLNQGQIPLHKASDYAVICRRNRFGAKTRIIDQTSFRLAPSCTRCSRVNARSGAPRWPKR
jgi:serine/threonine protein kinase